MGAATEAEEGYVAFDEVKGENLAGEEGLADGESVEMSLESEIADEENVELTIEFTTESGYTGTFTTLHFETVPICLISADAVTGATQIAFGLPADEEAATEAE